MCHDHMYECIVTLPFCIHGCLSSGYMSVLGCEGVVRTPPPKTHSNREFLAKYFNLVSKLRVISESHIPSYLLFASVHAHRVLHQLSLPSTQLPIEVGSSQSRMVDVIVFWT